MMNIDGQTLTTGQVDFLVLFALLGGMIAGYLIWGRKRKE